MAEGKQYTFIDLFAGLGGFHLALESLGCKCVFASELKEDLQSLYEKNFGIKPFGDITKVDIEKDIPPHDILCAGFPCQPFSQAGKRQGFDDEKMRGSMFGYICEVLKKHNPKFIILENVSNLIGHDGGNTWRVIEENLDKLEYDIDKAILSPHEYNIPQHRKRIYIVGRRREGQIKKFNFSFRKDPIMNEGTTIHSLIDEKDTNYIPLKDSTRIQLDLWSEFIKNTVANGCALPGFPIWAMEFGATYNFKEKAPAFQTLDELQGKRGHLGQLIDGQTKENCLAQLPNYAQTNKSEVFPSWKIRYIEQNREFYRKNKKWLDNWILKVKNLANSFLKLEWNCGNDTPSLDDKIIQFRASGIRVKRATYSPALNLVGTQIPILPWVQLPDSDKKGRYMTVKEAASLQGMLDLDFTGLSKGRIYEALGNAVNVEIVKRIVGDLIEYVD